MIKMLGLNEHVHGCHLNFPDTAFFDESGRISEIIKTDKEGFIVSTKKD